MAAYFAQMQMQPMVQPGMTNQGHSMTNQGYSMVNHGCGMGKPWLRYDEPDTNAPNAVLCAGKGVVPGHARSWHVRHLPGLLGVPRSSEHAAGKGVVPQCQVMPGMSDTRPSILGTPKSISTNIFQFKPSIEWGTPILGYRRNTQSNKQISLGAPSCSGQGPFLLMNVSFPTVMASQYQLCLYWN